MKKIRHIYIHVPFCSSTCDYCAFYSIAAPKKAAITAYLKRLQEEIDEKKSLLGPVETVFIGGGTPSFLDISELSRLLGIIAKNCCLSDTAECTLECNPESLSTEKISLLGSSFINRVSIGVQTFRPSHRIVIGRKGSLDLLNTKIDALIKSGIENISFDLIYGIPGQKTTDWHSDLRKAVAFPIRHISAYSLSVEESSSLAKKEKIIPCDDDLCADLWSYGSRFLTEKNGFLHYEISNYAQPGFECRHNRAFWRGQTYLGCGPAAVSFTGTLRIKNAENLSEWLNNNGIQEEAVPPKTRARELIALSMRMPEGITNDHFQICTGFSLSISFGKEIESWVDAGLVTYTGTRLFPTEKGLRFADYIAAQVI
jgi:oxygen-independent coproporphyrinogen III oxidase